MKQRSLLNDGRVALCTAAPEKSYFSFEIGDLWIFFSLNIYQESKRLDHEQLRLNFERAAKDFHVILLD